MWTRHGARAKPFCDFCVGGDVAKRSAKSKSTTFDAPFCNVSARAEFTERCISCTLACPRICLISFKHWWMLCIAREFRPNLLPDFMLRAPGFSLKWTNFVLT